jgi:DNA (cytosine-5)-methyltransferase 1
VVTHLNIFSGIGGMDIGLEIAMPGLVTVGYCERDAYAASVILARMANEELGNAPVFCGDIADLDATAFAGVDILSSSPPCQPYSQAGKRKGNTDERSHGDGSGPLVHLMRVIDECRPGVVFFENVPPWVSAGHFQSVRDALHDMDYRIKRPLFLAAGDVGAPHRRERVFIMAHARHARPQRETAPVPGGHKLRRHEREALNKFRPSCRELAHGASGGRREFREPSGQDGQSYGNSKGMARAEPVSCGADRGIFPPPPNGQWDDIHEWLLPAIEPGLRCMADGTALVVDADRSDQLRCIGNAVVLASEEWE